MELAIELLFKSLNKLLSYHRDLLNTVRAERIALSNAERSKIEEIVYLKEAAIQSIRNEESIRIKIVGELAVTLKKPVKELTLPLLILIVQERDAKKADSMRTVYQTLNLLIDRIRTQNNYNRELCMSSLRHINEMKKNVLGEGVPATETYSNSGKRGTNFKGARFISKEI